MKRNVTLFSYLMVAPATILVLALSVFPMLATLRDALYDRDLLRPASYGVPFVGFAHFRKLLFEEPRFWRAFSNTIMFVILAVSVSTTLGLIMALVLNRDMRIRGMLRSLILVPWVTPPVVASGIWIWLFSADRSPVNHVLRLLGLIQRPIGFLSDWQAEWGPVNLPMLSVTSVRVWRGLPFIAIMILAGLQSISQELYEAAQIDGANVWQRFRYVTLPLIKPVLMVLITLNTINGLGVFDLHYIMTNGGPVDRTNVLSVLLYQSAFEFYKLGYGAAVGVLILLMTGTIAAFYLRSVARRE